MNRIKKGFTLIELIIVIAVIAILSGVSIVAYTAIINSANESKILQQAVAFRDEDLINSEGNFELIPPLEVNKDSLNKFNTKVNYHGYYNPIENNYIVNVENSIMFFNTDSSKWNKEGINDEFTNKVNIHGKVLAEYRLLDNNKDIISYTNEVNSCNHEHTKIITIDNRECFLCLDCGLSGVDSKSIVLTHPTTSVKGSVKIVFEHDLEELFITKDIEKTPTANWFFAFFNDKNRDGVPEFDSLEYIDYTTVKYQYKYVSSDFTNYPQYDATYYGGVTDEMWDKLYEDWDDAYNNVPVENQNDQSIYDAIDEYYYDLEEQYSDLDEAANELYEEDVRIYEQETGNMVGNINPNKTRIITEEQKLYYFLHVPFDYDENKSYPFLVFYPGSGAVLFGYGYGTDLTENDFYYNKFRQTNANNPTKNPVNKISSSAMNPDGTWKSGQLTIRDGSWCGSFFSHWYNQIKTPGEGRDKYDCFAIFVQPTDANWWSGTYISMTNQYNVPEIEGAIKITSDMTGDTSYTGYSRPTYDSSYTSPAPDGQLACKLIDKMSLTYNIDLNRQYVAGASLGGAFTMDMINQYSDRFACGIPVVEASADITEHTAQKIVSNGMNVWAISGSGDTNCNKYFSKCFVQGLNQAKTDLGISDDYIYQYSLFPGGHSCGYIGNALRNADQGVSITYANQVLDFMFNSHK